MQRGTQLLLSIAALILFSLFLTAYTSRNLAVAAFGRSIVAELVYPAQLGLDLVSGGAQDSLTFVTEIFSARKENKELRAEVISLQRDLDLAAESLLENDRLRKLLNFKKRWSLDGVTARVIGRSASGWRQELVLSEGSASGVRKNMPVVSAEGVVGKIVSVSPDTSICLLLSDAVSGVGGIVQRTRAQGVVVGSGNPGELEFRYLSREEKIGIGFHIVTSGSDGVYPPGIPVGIVHEVNESRDPLFHDLILHPRADFSRLEEVLVVASQFEVDETLLTGNPDEPRGSESLSEVG